jgi:hypothetical protein
MHIKLRICKFICTDAQYLDRKKLEEIMKKTLLFFTALTLLWGNTAFAKDHMTFLHVPPHIKSLEGIQFVTGGIGIGERKILDRMADDYSLKVIFAMHDGHYLSQCQVEIIRSDGRKMLSAKTEGPWLLADLEPGSYLVKAQHDNTWKRQNVTVSADTLQQVIFNW